MPHTDPFRAIADPNRRRVLDLLHDRPLSVNELVRRVHLSQPATSQILNVLKSAGLVDHRREGRRVIYSVNNTDLKAVVDWIHKYDTPAPNNQAKADPLRDEAMHGGNPSGQLSH